MSELVESWNIMPAGGIDHPLFYKHVHKHIHIHPQIFTTVRP